jgi:FtsK/SpoIIIE family
VSKLSLRPSVNVTRRVCAWFGESPYWRQRRYTIPTTILVPALVYVLFSPGFALVKLAAVTALLSAGPWWFFNGGQWWPVVHLVHKAVQHGGMDPAHVRLRRARRTPWGWELLLRLSGGATTAALEKTASVFAVTFGALSAQVDKGGSAQWAVVRIFRSDPFSHLLRAGEPSHADGAGEIAQAGKSRWKPHLLGLTVRGAAVWDSALAPHVLVVGATGSGKSVCMEQAVCSLATDGWAWRFQLFDLKGVTLGPYAGARHVLGCAIDPGPATELLAGVVRQVRDRRQALLAAGVDHWTKSRSAIPFPLLVVIDEVAELLSAPIPGEDAKATKGRLERLRTDLGSVARLGRFVGVHLLLGLQRPDAAVLGGGEVRDNVNCRVALGNMSPDGLRMVFGAQSSGLVMPNVPGRGFIIGAPPAMTEPTPVAIPLPPRGMFAAVLDGAMSLG